jgi:hypothetical protein
LLRFGDAANHPFEPLVGFSLRIDHFGKAAALAAMKIDRGKAQFADGRLQLRKRGIHTERTGPNLFQ